MKYDFFILVIFLFIQISDQQFVTNVVNGNTTVTDIYPFFAHAGGCGGSILNERYILSAAHCFYNRNVSTVFFHVGRDHRSNMTGAVTHYAESIFVKSVSFSSRDDLALIKLTQPIAFNSRVQPVKLDHTFVPRFNESFSAIGFGVTETGIKSQDLRVGNLSVMLINSYSVTSSYSQVGMGVGDSGGPAFVYTHCDGFLQFGITSSGFCSTSNNTTTCSTTFTLINAENCAWLKEKSNNEIQC